MNLTLAQYAAMAMVSFAAATLAVCASQLIIGDGTVPILRIWDFQDGTGNAPLIVTKTATEEDFNNSAFYTVVPAGHKVDTGALGVAARLEGDGRVVGATLYAENDGEAGTVWGSNSIAYTWNGHPAVGMEVNGFNMSDDFALVRGIDIVNGGTAPTEFGLGIMTSNDRPAGKPRYGIVLGGPEFGYSAHAPASHAGIVIDPIDSGEAVRIAAGDFITLDGNAGNIRMRFNPDSEQIEFYNGDRLAYSIPM